ncbi:MAG: NYN domain-containing protein [Nitrospirae bacterium]|nr:NYN domain-containing protein [Nitrospirota bacterium]
MAHLLIDGYNLIGTGHNDLEGARKDIIDKLSRYSKATGHSITIVFDAWKREEASETIKKAGGVAVIYSRYAETADDLMIKMMAGKKDGLIVISSDRKIYDHALRNNIIAVTSGDFERKLNKALTPEDDINFHEGADDGEDFQSESIKGNHRKLSKKEKRRLQALKRL